MSQPDAVSHLEERLSEPLADEVSVEEMDVARKRRIGEQNRVASERLMGLMAMPRRGDG